MEGNLENSCGKNSFWKPLSIYVGTAIGAGIFSIPYVMAKFGFLPSLAYMAGLTIVNLLINLFYGEVVLRTDGNRQMVGYAGKYLNKFGKRAGLVILVSSSYGALLVYALGFGRFLSAVLSPCLGGTPFSYSLFFFLAMGAIVFCGIKLVTKAELVMGFFLVATTLALLFLGWPSIRWENFLSFHPENFFLPYGVILFAIGAVVVIPLMKESMGEGDSRAFRKAIIVGSLVSFAVYLTFAFVIVGITGESTSPEGIVGLGNLLGKKFLIIGSIFGALTMTTSFLTHSLVLKDMYALDCKMSRGWSWLLTCAVPLAIFLLGLNDFIKMISLVGAILGGLRCILIILIWIQSRKKGDRQPEYSMGSHRIVVPVLLLVFALGIAYQIFYALKK